jgi:hypothetical protein
MSLVRSTTVLLCLVLACTASQADEVITRGSNLSVDVAADGKLVMDLAGNLWGVPARGGEASLLTDVPGAAQRPRWSPDGQRIAYTVVDKQQQGIRVYEPGSKRTLEVSQGASFDLHPTWHPDGNRLTYASARGGTGFDLWEVDLPTGLHWRLSDLPGDETEPAWSADGRHVVFIYRDKDQWSLVLRRHGEPEETLVTGSDRLAGPSWRPDGSMVTYWRNSDEGLVLNMVILSQPRLIRRFMDGEDYVATPVSWLDKHRMYYAAGGVIRQRLFNSWSSRTVPFRATIDTVAAAVVEKVRRTLPRVDEPQGGLVIHASRLFDGIGGGYQHNRDIIIGGGRITAVEAHADRPDAIVIDMGDLTVLPGYIDAQARLPTGVDESTGPLLLAAGVTTVVAEHADAEHLNAIWSGKELPGPRLLPAEDWVVDNVSGLADSMTPQLGALLQSRPARLLDYDEPVARRFSEAPSLDAGRTALVLGSAASGLPTSLGVHAELRALVAAKLTPEQALRACGVNAAAALGVDPTLGRLATGAVADFVFVDGDPLADIDAALHVVAVVRNGRFFSVAGLIERSEAAETVE